MIDKTFPVDNDVYGIAPEHAQFPRDFKPWHKPRKQWVREEQWVTCMDRLIGNKVYGVSSVINYFGLPGQELLDARVIGRYIGSKNKKLKYIAVERAHNNSDRGHQLLLSELLDLEFIDGFSHIAHDRFESLSLKDSSLSSIFKSHCPFDAINLDFCDSVFPDVDGEKRYSAIFNMLKCQFDTAHKPWLLFITTRTQMDRVCLDISQKMIKHFIKELDPENTPLLLKQKVEEINSHLDDLESVKMDQPLSAVFIICFSLWILRISLDSKWSVNLISSASYAIADSQHPDMYSLVFCFDKRVDELVDPIAIAAPFSHLKSNQVDNKKLINSFVSKIQNSVNVDKLLASNKILYDKFACIMNQLLTSIGFSGEEYYIEVCKDDYLSAGWTLTKNKGSEELPDVKKDCLST